MATSPYNSRGTRDTRNAQDSIYGINSSLLVDLAAMPDGTKGHVATVALGLNLDAAAASLDLDRQAVSGLC